MLRGNSSSSIWNSTSANNRTPKSASKKTAGSLFDLQSDYSSPSRHHNYDPLKGLLDCEYPFRLSMYETPPFEEISLEDFESFALHRLYCKYVITIIDFIYLYVVCSIENG